MKAKQIHIGSDARNSVVAGIELVFSAVASTLGPYGSTVVIENDVRKDNPPGVTKDGVSVANIINLPDQLNQLGAKLVLQASTQADTKSGDGTTTTVVLATGLVARAISMLEDGMLPIQIREELLLSVDKMISMLTSIAERYPVTADTVRCVARISANGEEKLADVAIAATEAAMGGPVTVKSHREETDEIEILHGAIIPGAPLTLDLLDRSNKTTTADSPIVCLYNGRFNLAVLDGISNAYDNNFTGAAYRDSVPRIVVVIAKDMEDGVEEAVAKFNRNARTNQDICVIVLAAPGAGQQRQRYLTMLSHMISGSVVEPGQDIVFGEATALQLEANRSALIPNRAFNQDLYVEMLKAERSASSIGSIKYRQFDEILRFVLGRRVTVYVGGMTQADIKERQDRMVDAVHAIVAVQDGVIPGGGTVLAMNYDDPFSEAYTLPYRKILMNGGLSAAEAADTLEKATNLSNVEGLEHAYFYDLIRNEYVNLVDCPMPVYDPVRVTVNALRAAAQVAVTVVTSNCYIIED